MAKIKFYKKLPTLRQIKHLLINEAITRSDGDRSTAARKLGISKQVLEKHLQKKMIIKNMLIVFFIILVFTSANAGEYGNYIASQVVVRFQVNTGQEEIDKLINRFDMTIQEKIPQINYYIFHVPKAYTVPDIVSLWSDIDIVEKCEPNYVSQTQDVPSDTLFDRQWSLENQHYEGSDLHITDAWEVESGDPDVIVAIIDMGFDMTHEDLQENLWQNPGEIPDNGIDDDHNGYVDDIIGWDFVNQSKGTDDPDCDWSGEDNDPTAKLSSHGNRVWGVLGATTDNGIGIAGIAGNCKMMLIRAGFYNEDDTAVLSSAHIAKGLIYAADNGARVINISSGSNRYSESYKAALAYAINKGALVVCSAGNEGTDTPCYPSSYNLTGILSVGASTPQDKMAYFSNYGDWVDVSAPGQYIMTTLLDDRYGETQGTSFASPMVAGVAALLFSRFPGWTPAMVQDRIMNTVDICEGLAGTNITSGRVNAHQALTDASGDSTPRNEYSVPEPVSVQDGLADEMGCFIATSGTPYSQGNYMMMIITILGVTGLGCVHKRALKLATYGQALFNGCNRFFNT